jgi:hypothetical protein
MARAQRPLFVGGCDCRRVFAIHRERHKSFWCVA